AAAEEEAHPAESVPRADIANTPAAISTPLPTFTPGVPAPHQPARPLPEKNPALKEPRGFERTERNLRILELCCKVTPPLLEKDLVNCPDYRAAVLRDYPMTENAWKLLLPKLQSWRKEEKEKENHRAAQIAKEKAASEASDGSSSSPAYVRATSRS